MCLKIYKFDRPCCLTAPRLTWQKALKTQQLDLLTNINMSLITKIGIRGGICHPVF